MGFLTEILKLKLASLTGAGPQGSQRTRRDTHYQSINYLIGARFLYLYISLHFGGRLVLTSRHVRVRGLTSVCVFGGG